MMQRRKQITNKLVNLWLEELQDLAYDLDDLLDEFSTEALCYELIEKPQSSTDKIRALSRTFMRFNPVGAIFDSKKSKVNEITTKLQTMYKQISTLGLHVVNISRTPIQDRERQPTTSMTYEPRIYGREKSKIDIINLLQMEESDLGIIPITGKTEVRALTCLIELSSIKGCPKLLGTLPNNLPCLKTLKIEKCPKLLLDVPDLILPSITTISMEAVPCPSLPWLLETMNKLELSSLKSLDICDVSIHDTLCDPSVADKVEFANVASNHMNSLTSLNFQNIQNLRFLPKWFSEGLSGVESLEINDCNELTTLWQNVVTLEHCLPALQSLHIWDCPQLVSLFEEAAEERQQQQQLEGPFFMMRLESLRLGRCEKLEKLPRWLHTIPFLGELKINSCPSLVSFPEKGLPSTLRKLEIFKCGALESLPEWMTHTNYNLEVLKVDDCPVLKYIISPRAEEGVKINCPSLESFEIRFCNNLKFLPDASHNLKNLWRFEIALLNSLESIPEGWFSLPTNLREILISDIENLDALPHNLQNNSNFPSLEVLNVTSLRPSILKKIKLTLWRARYLETLCSREFQKLTSLQVLRISECPRLASVPSLPPSLRQLEIEFCAEFTSIPEQGLPQSLLKLTILYCPKFGSFPEQGLPQSLLQLSISFCPEFGSFPDQGLPQSLLELYVRECPKLKRLCEKDKGKYWPLIRHIPKVTIDIREEE
ncbi:hypothetical protein Acr_14g0002930 [Actinidia rufa]|uniref:Disease resistance N-terminal domain-containing protein n=1 Tax=Actinidia rufa TaxID=165716 RepID=A0A7J0FRW0_9ERIC|nr:hypothetical protein Acr_14g0002930 [Actinidia rufa]